MSTTLSSSFPSISRRRFVAKSSAMRRSSCGLSAAVCGAMTTCGIAHSGDSTGNGSTATTSRNAEPRRPDCSPSIRLASSITLPRPTLTMTAPGFVAAISSAPYRPSVAAVPGKGEDDGVRASDQLG